MGGKSRQSCFLGILVVMHLYLVSTNQTTVEWYYNQDRKKYNARRGLQEWNNPYDLGVRRNFQEVFGSGRYSYDLCLLFASCLSLSSFRFFFSWLLPGAGGFTDGTEFVTKDRSSLVGNSLTNIV